jgi:hypothetical protein
VNKETFIAKMKQKGWDFEVPDYSNTISPKESIVVGKTPDNGFWKGSYGVFVRNEDIEMLLEGNFEAFFEKLTGAFHFWDDWKESFKGSEFLIPVVEKELKIREHFAEQKLYNRLVGLKEGMYDLDESIAILKQSLTEYREKKHKA